MQPKFHTFVAIAMLFFTACSLSPEKPGAVNPEVHITPSIIPIGATDLYEQFFNDYDKAAQQYKGKTLAVTGIINHFNADTGGRFISLTGTHFGFVKCYIRDGIAISYSESNDSTIYVFKGLVVTLEGKFSHTTEHNIVLTNCKGN